MKKQVEEAVKNFKEFEKYSCRLMVEYADGFELLQKYLVKHHPNLNFSLLDMEEIEKEMLIVEADPINIAAEDAVVDVVGDAKNVAPVSDNINVE
ncbi:hypothetical protein SO802_021295 [Lithocarpus litseifolius]|uniref:Uncharacterized protein n=1 Tax=Lithocarpus litseifolius TaxID=425828 RepID=A0AAW2CEF3_9ROSI